MAQRGMWLAVLAAAGMQLVAARVAAKNCQTAADCGAAPATCELTTYQTCAGKDPGCAAGSACGDKPTTDNQANCAPYVEGICRQPYELSCQVDADCGVGFRCAEQIHALCMGSGTTGGNGVPPSSTQECHTVGGTFACELIATSCAADGDCATGLRCQRSWASACGGAVASPDSPDAALPVDDCAPAPMLCAPDGYFAGSTKDSGEVASSDDQGGTDGSLSVDASIPVVDEASAPNDSESPAHASDDGCSLAARGDGFELNWLVIAIALIIKRRLRASA